MLTDGMHVLCFAITGERRTADEAWLLVTATIKLSRNNWDMAVLKATHFGESKVVEMRLETFNIFNHPQFFGPTTVNANISSRHFAKIVSAMPSRVMQIAAKVNF